jgi:hypothetical protein
MVSLRLVVVWCACVLVFAVSTAAAAERCPNEAFRVGPSARLPDCRAYELVTPPELGRTADMIFERNEDKAVVSSEGEHVALFAEGAFVEPAANVYGTTALFSRTPTGWVMQPALAPGVAGEKAEIEALSPNLSLVALSPHSGLNTPPYEPNRIFDVGPFGGTYTTVATVPDQGRGEFETRFLGANAGTNGISAFSDVLLESNDRSLLPPGPERERAEEMKASDSDLYDWSDGQLHLVNVNNNGELISDCGAELGAGYNEGDTLNAISADGSRVFFTSPEAKYPQSPPCPQPQLYMRVDVRETVNVSQPQGVSIPLDERGEVRYDGASADGAEVFFTTTTGLTAGTGSGYKLYEYDAVAPEGQRLTLIANEVGFEGEFNNPDVVVSEDGSTVYYLGRGSVPGDEAVVESGIFRYEPATGQKRFVATRPETVIEKEPFYTTPNGGFLVFPAEANPVHGAVEFLGPHGIEVEMRGYEHNELYRYDATTGSVMCVSCGEGVAPMKGQTTQPRGSLGLLGTSDSSRSAISISEDGRRVFFQTSARLVPQDGNESTAEEELAGELGKGADVYEWEEDGTEEAHGVVCEMENGCIHLISAGEDVGPERFLGASENGENVFFTSTAQLVPQATPEFTNIYDARVDGGFPSPASTPECTSCQGVGSSQLPLNTPASETLAGAGNPAPGPPPKKSAVSCVKGRKRVRGKCMKTKTEHKAKIKRRGGGAGRGKS